MSFFYRGCGLPVRSPSRNVPRAALAAPLVTVHESSPTALRRHVGNSCRYVTVRRLNVFQRGYVINWLCLGGYVDVVDDVVLESMFVMLELRNAT